jgi:uncharacterized Zn-finger protein
MGGRLLSCGLCEEFLVDRNLLESHIDLVHNPQKSHRCEVCHFRFSSIDGLKSHGEHKHPTPPHTEKTPVEASKREAKTKSIKTRKSSRVKKQCSMTLKEELSDITVEEELFVTHLKPDPDSDNESPEARLDFGQGDMDSGDSWACEEVKPGSEDSWACEEDKPGSELKLETAKEEEVEEEVNGAKCLEVGSVIFEEKKLTSDDSEQLTTTASENEVVFQNEKSLSEIADINGEEKKKKKCLYCKRTFVEDDALKAHVKTHPRAIKYGAMNTCKICGHQARNSKLLRIHGMEVHGVNKMFKCEKCSFGGIDTRDLNNHIKAVHDKIKYEVCHICGFTTALASTLKGHIKRMHDEPKAHKCPHCPHTCSVKQNMKHHIKGMHDKVRDYICELCGFSASFPANLHRHKQAVHLGIKRHMCSLCGYACNQKSHLTAHTKSVHLGIKNHVCSICGYAAPQKGHLKRHMKTHKSIVQ